MGGEAPAAGLKHWVYERLRKESWDR